MRGIQKKKNSGSIETRTRTLREENEQCIILCKNCLLEQACNKPYIYTNFDLQSFFPYFCPRAEPPPFLFNPLSYKYLLIWAQLSCTILTILSGLELCDFCVLTITSTIIFFIFFPANTHTHTHTHTIKLKPLIFSFYYLKDYQVRFETLTIFPHQQY